MVGLRKMLLPLTTQSHDHPNVWKNKIHVPNHQPVNIIEYYIVGKIFPSQWIGLRESAGNHGFHHQI